MTVPCRLLSNPSSTPLFDSATTHRIEERASAGLPAHAMMERAGVALARLARAVAPHARGVWIAAGPGNNGGDGLVLASMLKGAGVEVSVSLVGHSARALPPDAAWALQRARDAGVTLLHGLPDAQALADIDLCVDALFGVGQTRAPEGEFAIAIDALNACDAPTLGIDVPTGLCTDTGTALGKSVVRATHTLTLLTAKVGLLTGTGRDVCGEIWFDDLGVQPAASDLPAAALVGEADVAPLYPRRRQDGNKGNFGDVHIAGGAAGMVGAALLAGHAASVAGAGRVLVHAHSSDHGGVLPVDVRYPELMLRAVIELQKAVRENANATVVVGCGGGDDVAIELAGCLSNAWRLVLDADALNALARDAGLREQLRRRAQRGQPTILTPHPLEAARLLGATAADVQADRPAAARRLAADTGAVVVLKGSGTLIATPGGQLMVNPTGDSRLATAGTGDVLAGWIGGSWSAQARARGAATATSDLALAHRVAVAAVFVHGRACDFATGARLPLIASELARAISRATEALID
jgi:hydroxyethylthiazole kinase-like uncharacterized protein yjeF